MIAGHYAFGDGLAIIAARLAGDRDRRGASQELYFAHQHEGTKLSFIDAHARGTVLDDETAVGTGKLRAEHVGIGYVILAGVAIVVRRANIEMAAIVLIEEAAEEGTAVKAGHAHPLDVGPAVYISQVAAIPDDAHVIPMNRHIPYLMIGLQRLSPRARPLWHSRAATPVAGSGWYIGPPTRRCSP